MAIIRQKGARRFRHYGSPEQGRRDTLPSVKGESMAQTQNEVLPAREKKQGMTAFLWSLFRRWVTMIVAGWAINLVVALVVEPLVWWGWNRGVAVMLSLPAISWRVAYAFTLFVTALASLFRAQLSVNTREE